MRALSSQLRKRLEYAVLAARREAERASRAALDGLGVFADKRPDHLEADQAALRNGLRAKWRQLGRDGDLLAAECAYEQWHRLLFARFLAENNLLLHPQYHAPVTLTDCEELAGELGEPDGWSVAARFASEILPGIFRLDDPCVRLRLAPEGRHELEQILERLPTEVFVADDALGWVYQFWQKDKKDEVNASERKIGGADLGPVTQLFTENYMVRFLLENSLGAWWAARHPESPLVKGFEYLRIDDDGIPAAGSFDGWPDRVADVTVMDPCCGSGHFLVEAFSMLWQMRAEEEGLSPVDAQDSVLSDNLFGLELDLRCVQIAMFAVALVTWRANRSWRPLPVPNIACSGISVRASMEEWKEPGKADMRLEEALIRLHRLFTDAETLGSLIDPRRIVEGRDPAAKLPSLGDVCWDDLAPLIETSGLAESADPATSVLGASALGIARASDYLLQSYTLVVTNPPFLGRGAQGDILRDFSLGMYSFAEADLAAVMIERWRHQALEICVVAPQALLSAATFSRMRAEWLTNSFLRLLVHLGAGAFKSIGGQVVQVVLVCARRADRAADRADLQAAEYQELDISSVASSEKPKALQTDTMRAISQHSQLLNPGHVLVRGGGRAGRWLAAHVEVREGLKAGDVNRFELSFWEVPSLGSVWEYLQGAPSTTAPFSGRSKLVRWENESGEMARLAESVRHLNHVAQNWRRGKPLWGRRGVVFSLMGSLNASLYTGERFSADCAAIVPTDNADVAALWEFARSGEWEASVREWHPALAVTPHNVTRIPFDLEIWRQVAQEAGPLPQARSDDPAQWLFEGQPEVSKAPLQVAVGRLVGYRWPEQDSDELDTVADADGIVCLPPVAEEAPASARLQEVLASAFGDAWSPTKLKQSLEQTGSRKILADWLRDEFFKQHCALFGNRPFVWHIWDGLKDGFSALVNYHGLDHRKLQKLTYTYLGQDWLERQRADVANKVPGADVRLRAALELRHKLEMILEGEDPYDIYVRWKEPHEQPIGWEPDLNDGVRLNIRPFVTAGVLRFTPNVHWRKDRGKNPDGSERHNDLHFSLAEKLEARKRAGRP